MTDEDHTEHGNGEPIPEELQSISTEEIAEADYNVVPSDMIDGTTDERNDEPRRPSGRHAAPGREFDSVGASSEDRDRDDDGHMYTAGYDSEAATRIGDETDGNGDVEDLRRHHEGRHRSDGEHSAREAQRDKKRIAQALCSNLPITDHERELVAEVMEQLDLGPFGSQKGIERVTIGVVAVIVDEIERDEFGPDREIVARQEEFRELQEQHDISMSDLTTIKAKVRNEMGEQRIVLGGNPRRDPNLPDPTTIDDRPGEYWDKMPARYWVSVAEDWKNVPQSFREGIPKKLRQRVEALRRWEVWTLSDEERENRSENGSSTAEADVESELDALEDEIEPADTE